MGPVRQNPFQRTVSLFICVCIAQCTIVAHNIAQNRPDSFPPYPPDNHHCSDDVYLREGGKQQHGQAGTRKVKPVWILMKQEIMGVSVALVRWTIIHIRIICTSLQTDNHASTSFTAHKNKMEKFGLRIKIKT